MQHTTINDGLPECKRCRQGDLDMVRLLAQSTIQGKRHLLHMHKHEDFVCLLTRLCAISPDEWRPKVTYYVYVDIGGLYYPIESASWVRDKDHLLVTTVEDVSDIPDIDMNAVHARLRDGTQLLPHQEEGVRRMIEMEQTETRGGILADEMGLGKTLQVLTMMIRQQPKLDIQAKTLVVVPSHGVADLWAEEIRLKTRFGALPYFIYDDHTKFLIEQPCFKVIIVTYDRLRSEYYRLYVNNQTSPLFDTHWFRVVLDECNKLHDNKSKLTGAVLGLDTSFRWCLTGTPLQNNTIELLPIFKFLNIDLPPLAKRHESKCYADILAKHMIRRKVDQLSTKSLMKQKTEIRVVLKFTPPERALYDYLETILYKQLQNDQKRRQIKGGNPGLNVLYLRLKQVCNHHLILLNKFPDLIPMAKTQSEEQVANAIQNSNVPGVNSRSVEGQQLNSELDQVRNLIKDFYNQNTAGVIPTPNMEDLEKLPFIRQSTKVSWLITFLNESIENSSSDKIIVVSQFAELLMIISDLLKQIKLKHECYTGDMKPFHRKQSLERFQTNPKCQILLLSLKAGGVGLNLQCANHMVLLDQWWNPAVMDQAVARIHRMKQTKETFIHTVVIKDTIEEGLIDAVLKKKISLFESVVDPTSTSGWTQNGKAPVDIYDDLDLDIDEELAAAAAATDDDSMDFGFGNGMDQDEIQYISDDNDNDNDYDDDDDGVDTVDTPTPSFYLPKNKRPFLID